MFDLIICDWGEMVVLPWSATSFQLPVADCPPIAVSFERCVSDRCAPSLLSLVLSLSVEKKHKKKITNRKLVMKFDCEPTISYRTGVVTVQCRSIRAKIIAIQPNSAHVL